MSAAPHQLALDFTKPPAPPPPVYVEPPRRPCALKLEAQRARTERVRKATEAKIRAVPQAKRKRWVVPDVTGRGELTRLDLMLADLHGFGVIDRWVHGPAMDALWDAMRKHDVPHGACRLERCHRTREVVLVADLHAAGHFEERLDA